MAYHLSFDDGFPQLNPDPPGAMVQFEAIWSCTNTGDEPSPETAVWVDVFDSNSQIALTSFGRNVASLAPNGADSDRLAVGAVGSGTWTVRVSLDSFGNGDIATIPLSIP
ncbi:MAG: hypothetical protein HY782_22615 [Chloroflexi bacterium]|nr:hypothetical protein [Chloroflexota bacterium]